MDVRSHHALHVLMDVRRHFVISFGFAFLLSGVAGATAVPPTSQVSRVASEPVAARVVEAAGDTSFLLIAGVSLGFAAAGIAFAIAVFTGVQGLRRRSWIEHTGEPDERPERPASHPAPAPASPATPAPAAPATPLVDVVQPSARLTTASAGDQQDEVVVALWRGYMKSRFYATSTEPDGTETTVAASPFFRPERYVLIEESHSARAAYADLTRKLAEHGWEPIGTDETFASLFRRRSGATGGP